MEWTELTVTEPWLGKESREQALWQVSEPRQSEEGIPNGVMSISILGMCGYLSLGH